MDSNQMDVSEEASNEASRSAENRVAVPKDSSRSETQVKDNLKSFSKKIADSNKILLKHC